MKTQMSFLITFLCAFQLFASYSLEKHQDQIRQVNKLEKSGSILDALFVAKAASEEIIANLNVGGVVSSIDSQLNEIRNEIIVSKHSSKINFSFFSLILGPVTGSASRKWDTTKIITANPDDVAEFPTKIASDFRVLKENLVKYVRDNELALVYAKVFAAKAVQLSTLISVEERASLRSSIHTLVQQSQLMNFLGVQSILSCVTTNYTNRSNSSSFNMTGLFFKIGAESNSDYLAHSVKTCDPAISKYAEVNEMVAASANIYKADMLIKHYYKQFGLKEVMDSPDYFYPTWGR